MKSLLLSAMRENLSLAANYMGHAIATSSREIRRAYLVTAHWLVLEALHLQLLADVEDS